MGGTCNQRVARETPVPLRIENDQRLVGGLKNGMRAQRAVSALGHALKPIRRGEVAAHRPYLGLEELRLFIDQTDEDHLCVEDELDQVCDPIKIDIALELGRAVPSQCLPSVGLVRRQDGRQIAVLLVEELYTLADVEVIRQARAAIRLPNGTKPLRGLGSQCWACTSCNKLGISARARVAAGYWQSCRRWLYVRI